MNASATTELAPSPPAAASAEPSQSLPAAVSSVLVRDSIIPRTDADVVQLVIDYATDYIRSHMSTASLIAFASASSDGAVNLDLYPDIAEPQRRGVLAACLAMAVVLGRLPSQPTMPAGGGDAAIDSSAAQRGTVA